MSKSTSSRKPRFALALRKFLLSFFVVFTFVAYAIRNQMDTTDSNANRVPTTLPLLAQHPDETIALVSHGRVLSMVLAQFSGEDPVSIWDSLKMPAYAVLSLPEKKVLALVRDIVEEI